MMLIYNLVLLRKAIIKNNWKLRLMLKVIELKMSKSQFKIINLLSKVNVNRMIIIDQKNHHFLNLQHYHRAYKLINSNHV